MIPPKTNRSRKVQEKEEIAVINKVLEAIDTKDIGETNDLILAGAIVVTKRLGLNKPTKNTERVKKNQQLEKELRRT